MSQSCEQALQRSAWQLLNRVFSEDAFPLQQLLQWDFQQSSGSAQLLASVVQALKAMLPPQELQELLLDCTSRGIKVRRLSSRPQALCRVTNKMSTCVSDSTRAYMMGNCSYNRQQHSAANYFDLKGHLEAKRVP